MPSFDPHIILRLGSHSEKDYFEKIIRFLDGYFIAANLIESTPGASASLVLRFSGQKTKSPYYLDPMTYAFGSYVDPQTQIKRNDLDWIKSDQKQNKKQVRDFKRSYRNLANNLGGLFSTVINRAKSNESAISITDLSEESAISNTCEIVVRYQLNRIRDIFKEDPEIKQFANDIPDPAAIIAPYFYIEPSAWQNWLEINLKLMEKTCKIGSSLPIHGVICMDESSILDRAIIGMIEDKLPKVGLSAIWLWLSKIKEDELIGNKSTDVRGKESFRKMKALKSLTEYLSKSMEVYNMHGGYFSLALSKFGMKGISHGVGYGEQKDVVPVIGKTIPTVRYYLPDLHRRLGVPDIERCFASLGIKKPEDFYEKICDCTICKGVVNSAVDQISLFGEVEPLKPGKKKSMQTPAAAKKCRFHFLLNRIRERDWIKANNTKNIVDNLTASVEKWGDNRSVENYCAHLNAWAIVLNE